MSGKHTNHDEEPQTSEAQESDAQEQEMQELLAEETEDEPTRPITALPMRMKRCKDHPANFPDEDSLRPLSEFYGQGRHSYCKRCDSIRSKRHREQLRTRGLIPSAELAPFRTGMLRRAAEIRVDMGTTPEEAINALLEEVSLALPFLRDYLQQALAVEPEEPPEE